MRLFPLLCILLSSVFLLELGCARKTVVGSEARVMTEGNAYESNIVYATGKLKRTVTVMNAIARKRGDLTEGSLTLVNLKKKSVSLAYKFMWFDKDGFEVSADAAAWTPIFLQGLEQKTLQSLAPRQSALAFKIKVANQ